MEDGVGDVDVENDNRFDALLKFIHIFIWSLNCFILLRY